MRWEPREVGDWSGSAARIETVVVPAVRYPRPAVGEVRKQTGVCFGFALVGCVGINQQCIIVNAIHDSRDIGVGS